MFDPTKHPWIQPDNVTADQLAEAVRSCPSGALQFARAAGWKLNSIALAGGPARVLSLVAFDAASTGIGCT